MTVFRKWYMEYYTVNYMFWPLDLPHPPEHTIQIVYYLNKFKVNLMMTNVKGRNM
jgi:hypothetical protein